MRSLLEVLAETGRMPKQLEVVERGGTFPHVRCGCGRVCPADMMFNVQGAWRCDGCVARHQREHGLSRRQVPDA